ncbi:MAG: hypothetical protein HY961_15475 [Ignavibacteriae bacterium]|nr:hypothetical protein [Ignavibacteriota bacterium]
MPALQVVSFFVIDLGREIPTFRLVRIGTIQSNPIQSNPIQSNPIQSNPIQSNPIQVGL